MNGRADNRIAVGDLLPYKHLVPHLDKRFARGPGMLLHGDDDLRRRRHYFGFHLRRVLIMRHMRPAMCFERLFWKCKFHSFPSIFIFYFLPKKTVVQNIVLSNGTAA